MKPLSQGFDRSSPMVSDASLSRQLTETQTMVAANAIKVPKETGGMLGSLQLGWDKTMRRRFYDTFLRRLRLGATQTFDEAADLVRLWLMPAFAEHCRAHADDEAYARDTVAPASVRRLFDGDLAAEIISLFHSETQ